jgi:hypothetical protein
VSFLNASDEESSDDIWGLTTNVNHSPFLFIFTIHSVPMAKIGVSGGLFIKVDIDLFDPFPKTSGGLVSDFYFYGWRP